MKAKIAGGAIAAIVAAVAYFVVPTLQVEATNAAGAGWNEAHAEFKAQYVQGITSAVGAGTIPADQINKVADCVATKTVEFLNGTDCSYLYNESTTSEQEHLANQDACFTKVGFEAKVEEFNTACATQHIPGFGQEEAPAAAAAPAADGAAPAAATAPAAVPATAPAPEAPAAAPAQ